MDVYLVLQVERDVGRLFPKVGREPPGFDCQLGIPSRFPRRPSRRVV